MTKLAIIVAKIIIFFGDIFKRGSALPGYVARKIDKDIFEKLEYPEDVIMVTGTNGKTSTNNFIAQILSGPPHDLLANKEGANMPQGILSTVLRHTGLNGKVKKDTALFEVDEGFLGEMIGKIKPKYLIITNLFDDQIDRFGSAYELKERLLKIDYSGIRIIANANDPIVVDLARKSNAEEIIYFGLSPYKDSDPNIDIKCPNCGRTLDYTNVMYSKIGYYSCSCGLKTPETKYLATNIDLKKGEFDLGGYTFKSNYKTDYFIFNLLGAISLAKEMGLSDSLIEKRLEGFEIGGGRLESFNFNGQPSFLNLIKNPAGLSASLSYIESLSLDSFNLYLGVNKNPADGTDASWLSSVDFSFFNNPALKRVYIEGGALEELKEALKKSGIKEEKITSNLTTEGIVSKMKEEGLPGLFLVNYTKMNDLRQALSLK